LLRAKRPFFARSLSRFEKYETITCLISSICLFASANSSSMNRIEKSGMIYTLRLRVQTFPPFFKKCVDNNFQVSHSYFTTERFSITIFNIMHDLYWIFNIHPNSHCINEKSNEILIMKLKKNYWKVIERKVENEENVEEITSTFFQNEFVNLNE
jgi:hypothetical protein